MIPIEHKIEALMTNQTHLANRLMSIEARLEAAAQEVEKSEIPGEFEHVICDNCEADLGWILEGAEVTCPNCKLAC